jgi:translocation and assembly module TamA
MRSRIPVLFAAFVVLCTMPRARAADPQPYRVDITATGNGPLDDTLRASSELATLRDTAPISPFGLIARARGEADRLKTVLESYGYYESAVTVKIEGQALNAAALVETLNALPKGQDARVSVAFALGPLYHLGKVAIDGTLPESAAAALDLKSGAPAVAADVLAAGARLVSALQEQGYAFAKVDPPLAYEDQTLPLLDVTFHVEPGPRVNIGQIHLEGLGRVHEKLIRRRLTIHTGQRYSSSAIEAARRDLATLGVFAAITVKLGTEADATGGVPVTFSVRERPRHAVAVNAAYSTDLGGSGGVSWTDRNVFGNAEQLSITATAIDVGGNSTTGIGYDTSAKFTIPDLFHRDQSLQFAVTALKQSLQAYTQQSVATSAVFSRKLSSVWSASAGVSTAVEHITPAGPPPLVTDNYTLVSLPLGLSYDSTHLASPLDDPVHGMRDSLSITPTQSLGRLDPTQIHSRSDATFVISQIKLAAYFDLNELGFGAPGRSVLAARVLAGVAQGAGQDSLPPDQRFYGGGSATIRGYPYQAVGPFTQPVTITSVNAKTGAATKTTWGPFPLGGTAIEAGSIEFRQRFGQNFGAAFFVDAGQVGSSLASLKTIGSQFSIGVGAGVRYYTGIGPIRFDVAVPTRSYLGSYQAVQVYIGLGQAF